MTARKAAPKAAKARRQSASAAKSRAKATAPAPRARAPAPPKALAKAATLTARPQRMSAVVSVKRDLKRLPSELAESAEAATALVMAQRLDDSEGSPSECAKVLMDAMGRLRAMAPPEEKKGALHGIRSGRALRLAAGSPAGED
jgi:hypothetical protein